MCNVRSTFKYNFMCRNCKSALFEKLHLCLCIFKSVYYIQLFVTFPEKLVKCRNTSISRKKIGVIPVVMKV